MTQSNPIRFDQFRWKGFWREGVSRTTEGGALFTEEGFRYYAFWCRKFKRTEPYQGMNYEEFALGFLTIIKLHRCKKDAGSVEYSNEQSRDYG
ncbi:MAG: hypothetical protein PHV99_03445 [Candidatus Pacebacteria bacterium]|jgi:hypothetical protein|uniref:Uncharacterized protein n=1 Tax=Aromatoleum aromaticum (strain DSM 19018 / LMG 30748 / EbN1) TaxID=76114 RepID=Q5NX30_AROAE|nr:hypothetical protein [Candidatus Paceibacterota bacterium]CAI10384.1 hypothetical protein p1B187 [Aromatoleum aromaticum EbN1]